jgi:hypothetical protein
VKAAFRRLIALNDAFAELAGRTLSWSIWFTIMVIGTVVWASVNELTRGRFDPQWINLVLVLTIVTALDAGATKLFQLSLRRKDERADERMRQLLEVQNETLKALHSNTAMIGESLNLQTARDEANISVILKIIEALNARSEDLQHVLGKVEDGVEKLDIRSEEIDIIGKRLALLQQMLERRADLFESLIAKTEEINLQLHEGRKYYTEVLAQNLARLDLIIQRLGA